MAKMIEYLNPNHHVVQIATPEKKIIKIKGKDKIVLSEWYMKYCPKYLRVVRTVDEAPTIIPKKVETNNYILEKSPDPEPAKRRIKAEPAVEAMANAKIKSQVPIKLANEAKIKRGKKPIVGRRSRENSRQLFAQACQNNKYTISNNIGVGILSYNRLYTLQRLIYSIRKHTDLRRTTIFVSDESTDPEVPKWLKEQTDIVVLTNQPRLGVAGNTNRLFRCLNRFKFALILNDDVEILNPGWETFYVNAYAASNVHHFCYHQVGVYGAQRGNKITPVGPYRIETITEKPHGAVLFYTQALFKKIGYFDEQFGLYGMEHVDWSTRAYLSGTQGPGYHDVLGSEQYFQIHAEVSAATDRGGALNEARKLFESISGPSRIYVDASVKTDVPSISVVIPLRNIGRQGGVEMVVGSMRGQLFPQIDIVLVEQDIKSNVNVNDIWPCQQLLAKNKYPDQPFTKAMAFNLGVTRALFNKIILQDADIMVPANYFAKIHSLLDTHDGVHIGAKVLYLSEASSNQVISTKYVTETSDCERAVEYFEGGSLACTKSAYARVGGFNEIFEGYGIEDCDFFARLRDFSQLYNIRTEDFVHLWHGRTPGWEAHHLKNKTIYQHISKSQTPANYVASLVHKLKQSYPELLRS